LIKQDCLDSERMFTMWNALARAKSLNDQAFDVSLWEGLARTRGVKKPPAGYAAGG
jgi:hypothetical protein